ncbi:hypothetical protein THAOC_14188 [Thalassiosira oceanica]|uniref:Aminomethyltransferase folate-binding domain-containing protein n=1 Tax=Thalassiosira oceanica TaxID=159749 RepID=K0T3M4_THAOC|nr:hypothetical protein THAOC_14188 [Thalassiosira oceanica]|eukprot:EJK65017.1 hypothetical protein THAOC_14188 [Thalassiosira oceanica]
MTRIVPPYIVGEAVRSALRSDRGVCFDFTTDRYASNQAHDGLGRSVSVVKIEGKGTTQFLNAKFSQSVPAKDRSFAYKTAYLTPKGRVNDVLLVVATPDENGLVNEAFLVTSPGNSGSTLYDQLSPFVFPMDQVKLIDCSPSNESIQTTVITLACSKIHDARTSFNKNVVLDVLAEAGNKPFEDFELPSLGECIHFKAGTDDSTDLFILQHTFLPQESCRGYTIILQEDLSNPNPLADRVWDNLTAEDNDKGPVGLGALEFESLRVESGSPGFGTEYTGDGSKKSEDGFDQQESSSSNYHAKANPMELHLGNLIDIEKGCYQGQEGIAAVLKNKRGPARQLYQVAFYDSENDFDGSSSGFGMLTIDNDKLAGFQEIAKNAATIENDTRQPRAGDKLYVLGSNESIEVGRITSASEPNGSGDAKTLALALVKRPGPILKAITEQNLDLPMWWEDEDDGEDPTERNLGSRREDAGSGILKPPPLDQLHNLEVVIGGSYTVGRLLAVPSRRYEYKSNGDVASLLDYEKLGRVVNTEEGGSPGYFQYNFDDRAEDDTSIIEVQDDDMLDEEMSTIEEEAERAAAEMEAALEEVKRKEEKMKMLKAKAEAAMAKRQKKQEGTKPVDDEAEAQRKEEKMARLKAQAEAAMARRRKKHS